MFPAWQLRSEFQQFMQQMQEKLDKMQAENILLIKQIGEKHFRPSSILYHSRF
jgi:hypothetical protein